MAKDDDDGPELPFVMKCDVARLPGEGIAIQITYATSAERFAARQMDTMVFAMTREVASGLGRALLKQTDPATPPPKKPTMN